IRPLTIAPSMSSPTTAPTRPMLTGYAPPWRHSISPASGYTLRCESVQQMTTSLQYVQAKLRFSTMIPDQLLLELQKLNRVDKLRVVQMLVNELALEEGVVLPADVEYPVYTP